METSNYEAALLKRILDVLDGIFDTVQRLDNRLELRNSQSSDRSKPQAGPLLLSLADAVIPLGVDRAHSSPSRVRAADSGYKGRQAYLLQG